MTGWIEWWCHLIGITDPTAVQIATGIVAGGSALGLLYFGLMMVLMVIGGIFSLFK